MHKRIQVVDENGIFSGHANSPNEARDKGQVRLIARVMLQNKDGKYLLQKRSENLHAWPGCWDNSAAGHVDEGEDVETAAYRELAEEVGVTNIKLRLSRKLYHGDPHVEDQARNHMFSYIYLGEFNGDSNTLQLQPDEVSEVRWFSESEIQKMIKNQPDRVTDGILIFFGDVR